MSESTPSERGSVDYASLDPSCFSIVMATGIVSIASAYVGAAVSWLSLVSLALLWINVSVFALQIVLTGVRVLRSFPRVIADLFDHKRAFGFFSMVAASAVLGGQFLLIADLPGVALTLWCFAAGLWLAFTYLIFTCVTIMRNKPSLNDGLHGGWLLAVVATQSVSILGVLCVEFVEFRDLMLFVSLALWLSGGMLYVLIISLIFYRYCFGAIDVESMSPPYWINMGAMAISTLAGTTLIEAAHSSPLLTQILPFMKGMALLCWSTATWWIPLLVMLGLWRHVFQRKKLEYDLRYWSIVFPLGMYSVSTRGVSHAMDVHLLDQLSTLFAYIALAAWLLTSVGLGRHLVRSFYRSGERSGPYSRAAGEDSC